MTTNARIQRTPESSHWYYPDGRPCYEVPKKSGGGTRATNIKDAISLGLLPSVTEVLKMMAKPELTNWLIEQAVLAVLTTPKLPNEQQDAFVKRVLSDERIQDEEAKKARERGTAMHDALEKLWKGEPVEPELLPWVTPAFEAMKLEFGDRINTEVVVVGRGYAGRVDLVAGKVEQNARIVSVVDFKTTNKGRDKLPDPARGAWPEHRLQLSAYAGAIEESIDAIEIRTANVYISTLEPGAFTICKQEEWRTTFQEGFMPLLAVWQWFNQYKPQPKGLKLDTDPI